MFHIILYQPEIPPNTGNIIRLCANTGMQLHLIKPLGFPLKDKQLIRAGLDYHEFAAMKVHENWQDCRVSLPTHRLFAITTKGKYRYDTVCYQENDVFVFGSETRGLPAEIMNGFTENQRLRIPMMASSRSLNLSNSAAIVVYEAWRQIGFLRGC